MDLLFQIDLIDGDIIWFLNTDSTIAESTINADLLLSLIADSWHLYSGVWIDFWMEDDVLFHQLYMDVDAKHLSKTAIESVS